MYLVSIAFFLVMALLIAAGSGAGLAAPARKPEGRR